MQTGFLPQTSLTAARTARRTASRTTSGSRRRGRGMRIERVENGVDDRFLERPAGSIGQRQADELDLRIAEDIALGSSITSTPTWPAEGQPPPLGDADRLRPPISVPSL